MSRYEREYGSDAEREFFGQDWSKLVTEYNGVDPDGDVDSQQASTQAPAADEWGQAKPRLSEALLRSGAGVGSSAGRIPKWMSLSVLIAAILSGFAWLTLGGGSETTAKAPPSSAEPPSPRGLAFTATAATHAGQAELTALSLPSVPPSETVPGGLPSTAAPRTLDAEHATSLNGRSSQAASDTDADSTFARQAVDAVLAGDRARALHLYRELARRAPQRELYREATRILSREAAPSSKTPGQRPAAPSPRASEAR
jgi:hypothetical protein